MKDKCTEKNFKVFLNFIVGLQGITIVWSYRSITGYGKLDGFRIGNHDITLGRLYCPWAFVMLSVADNKIVCLVTCLQKHPQQTSEDL